MTDKERDDVELRIQALMPSFKEFVTAYVTTTKVSEYELICIFLTSAASYVAALHNVYAKKGLPLPLNDPLRVEWELNGYTVEASVKRIK